MLSVCIAGQEGVCGVHPGAPPCVQLCALELTPCLILTLQCWLLPAEKPQAGDCIGQPREELSDTSALPTLMWASKVGLKRLGRGYPTANPAFLEENSTTYPQLLYVSQVLMSLHHTKRSETLEKVRLEPTY